LRLALSFEVDPSASLPDGTRRHKYSEEDIVTAVAAQRLFYLLSAPQFG
jgi:hypothetical protein